MNKTEYDSLFSSPLQRFVASVDLTNQDRRTLIFGYTVDRNTFHVYLDVTGINVVVYDHMKLLLSHRSEKDGLLPSNCVPDKRVYPAACDFEFCLLLQRLGVNIPFTTWDERDPAQCWFGERLETLNVAFTAQDFEVDFFEIGLANLGLTDLRELALVRERIEGQMRGALRADILLAPDVPGNKEKWISNIPSAVEFAIRNSRYDDSGYSLTPNVATELMTAAAALVDERSAKLKARRA